MSTYNALAHKQAEALQDLYLFCFKNKLTLTINPSTVQIEYKEKAFIADVDPAGCKFAAGQAIYKVMKEIKRLLNVQKEANQLEQRLFADYLENGC